MTPKQLLIQSVIWMLATLVILLYFGITSYVGAFWFMLMFGSVGWANFIMLALFPPNRSSPETT